MRISRAIIALTIAVLAPGCGEAPTPNQAENNTARAADSQCGPADGMIVADAWMRSSRKGQPTSAAYLRLTNCSKADDALIAVSFKGAAAAELHGTNMSDDGLVSMKQEKTIAIPAGAAISMEPDGGHIMLIGMTDAIAKGEDSVMTLEFQNAAALDVTFDVRDLVEAENHNAH